MRERTLTVGIHVLGNLKGCPRDLLEKIDVVRDILKKVVEEAKLKPVGQAFHQFEPFGVTGVFVLAESHMSVHTWPEKNFVAVDIFTCGEEGNAEEAFDILCKYFKPEKFDKQIVRR